MEQATSAPWRRAFIEAAAAFVLAGIVLALAYALLFFRVHPEFRAFAGHDVETVTIPGNRFRPVAAGRAYARDGSMVIDAFAGGGAVVALNARFLAEDYPFIKLDIDGLTSWANAAIYWRRAAEPDVIYQLPLNRSGDGVTQVAMPKGSEKYRGEIIELAVGFIADATGHDNGGQRLRVKGVELRPFSSGRVIEQLLADWLNPPVLQAYSNNVVIGSHPHSLLRPNGIVMLLMIVGLAGLGAAVHLLKVPAGTGQQRQLLRAALCLCLYGWGCGEVLRWQWRLSEGEVILERYAGRPLAEQIKNAPLRCGRDRDCVSDLLPYL
ncbi:hypothetical protein [Pseudohaliea rubra]|uniref:hypothetical protein n=1 Tax=Pseudohaliea rubra TaxID=475795 RepID=UPI0011857FC8|nr:hypothetical protein [Pseudohaliea rubra]